MALLAHHGLYDVGGDEARARADRFSKLLELRVGVARFCRQVELVEDAAPPLGSVASFAFEERAYRLGPLHPESTFALTH